MMQANPSQDSPARRYALLLRLYPAEYQRTFGAEMLQTFRDQYAGEGAPVGGAALRFWLALLGDEARGIAREHLAAIIEEIHPMRKIYLLVIVLLPVLISLLWVSVPAGPTSASALLVGLFQVLPPLAMALGLIGLLAALLRARAVPGVAQSGSRDWLRTALVFSGVSLLMGVVWQLIQLFAPNADNNFEMVITILGLLVLFGALGLISGHTSGQMRTGVYAGLLAAGLNWVLGLALAVGLALAAWLLFQRGTLASPWGLDYQRFQPGAAGAWGLVQQVVLQHDLGWFFFVQSALFATLGSALGALLSGRQAAATQAHPNPSDAISARAAGWRSWPVIATVVVWVTAFAILNSQHGQPTGVLGPVPNLLPELLSMAGLTAWLLILLVVLAAMRQNVSTKRSHLSTN